MQFPEQQKQPMDLSNKSEDQPEVKDVPAVFNKRLFAAQGSVTITPKAKSIMGKNENLLSDFDLESYLTKSELHAMRCVVDGLKLIHKGHDYAKDVLCHVITMETFGPNQYVVKKSWEDNLSCYYIVCGAVEVRYDVRGGHSRNVYQSDIVYNHGTGEYLGIVSLEGQEEDIAPPSSVYTKELTQFLRIDRLKFHKLVKKYLSKIKTDIMKFLTNSGSIFKSISDEAKEKILPKLEVQEYRPNRIILSQGQNSNFLYFVISGRCRCNRRVYIPEAGKEVLFYLCCKEDGEFFGEECILDNDVSYNKVTAITDVKCYRLHRSAFEIVKGGLLTQIVQQNRDEVLTDEELQIRGYKNSVWNYYKHTKVKEPLRERDHLKYLTKKKTPRLAERPLTASEQYRENMLRFKEKGYGYKPVRARTATYRRPVSSVSSRARSARVRTSSPRMYSVRDENYDSDQGTEVSDVEVEKENATKPLSDEIAKTLEKHADHLDEDSDIAKLLAENEELARHLQNSMEGPKVTSVDKESFMKNSVLATMKSEDIVRKAMAMADKKAENMKRGKKAEEEEWSTVLHAENRQAKFLISMNKMKMAVLRKQLDEIENLRTKRALKLNQNGNVLGQEKLLQKRRNEQDITPKDTEENKIYSDKNGESRDGRDMYVDKVNENKNRCDTDLNEDTPSFTYYRDTAYGIKFTGLEDNQLNGQVPHEEGNGKFDENQVSDTEIFRDTDNYLNRLDTRIRPLDDISLSVNTELGLTKEQSISARF